MADLPDDSKLQGEIKEVRIINPADNKPQFKEYRPDCILITHALVPIILGTDPIKGLCQQYGINLWCRLLTKPFIRFTPAIFETGVSKALTLPFDRALFFVTLPDWQKLKSVTDELSIYIDGQCNIAVWERVQLPDVEELNLKKARISVLGLCDPKRYLKPVFENGYITFIRTDPIPYSGAIASKHTEIKDQILDQLKEWKDR
jgi:hypothetical protein